MFTHTITAAIENGWGQTQGKCTQATEQETIVWEREREEKRWAENAKGRKASESTKTTLFKCVSSGAMREDRRIYLLTYSRRETSWHTPQTTEKERESGTRTAYGALPSQPYALAHKELTRFGSQAVCLRRFSHSRSKYCLHGNGGCVYVCPTHTNCNIIWATDRKCEWNGDRTVNVSRRIRDVSNQSKRMWILLGSPMKRNLANESPYKSTMLAIEWAGKERERETDRDRRSL